MGALPQLSGYRLNNSLNSGTWSTVYLAEDLFDQKACVVKVFNTSSGAWAHYRAEIQALARLEHPNLVRLIGFGTTTDTGQGFIALEYLQGRDFVSASRDVSQLHFFSMIVQVCRALDYLRSRGIVHGDLNPRNILVVTDPAAPANPPLVKIVDLGFAADTRRPQLSPLFGTATYLAPEVIRGERGTHLSDLYSFGVILYECLAGSPPYSAEDIGAVLQKQIEAPPPTLKTESLKELHPLIHQLLAKDPLRRPPFPEDIMRLVNSVSLQGQFRLHTAETWTARVKSSPLAGRDRLLSDVSTVLEDVLHARGDSVPRLIVLTGPPGSGKSSIAREIALRAGLRGMRVQFLRSIAGPHGLDRPHEQASRNGDHATNGASLSLFDGFRGAPGPLEIRTLEDFVSLRSCPWVGVLTVDTTSTPRDAVVRLVERLSERAHVVEWTLPPLCQEELLAALRGMLSVSDVDNELLAYVHRRSGGNPFVAGEVLTALLDQGLVTAQSGKLAIRSSLESLKLSERLDNYVHELLKTLSPSESRLLDILSIADDQLTTSDLSTLLGTVDSSEQETLDSLTYRGLLVSEPGAPYPTFRLASDIIRERHACALSLEHRRALSATLAHWYKDNPSRPHSLERAALRFIEAQMQNEAVESCVAAALQADLRNDYRSSARYCRLALDNAPPTWPAAPTISLLLATALRKLGDMDGSLRLLEHLIATHNVPDNLRVRAHLVRSESALLRGHVQVAEASGREALALARKVGARPEAIEAMRLLGLTLSSQGQRRSGEQFLFLAAVGARRGKMRRLAALALQSVASARWKMGDYRSALNYQRRAYKLFRSRETTDLEASAVANIGILQSDIGHYQRSRLSHRLALALADELGMRGAVAKIHNNIGETFRATGQWRTALSSYSVAADASVRTGADLTSLNTDESRARVLATAGYYSQSITFLKHSLYVAHSLGSIEVKCCLQIAWGILLFTIGKVEGALKLLRTAIVLSEEAQLWPRTIEAKTYLSLSLVTLGRSEEARDCLDTCLRAHEIQAPLDLKLSAHLSLVHIRLTSDAAWTSIETPLQTLTNTARSKRMDWHLAWALMIRAEGLLSINRGGEAEADLEEAIRLSQKNADRTHFWQASYLLGRVHEQMLRYERALTCYRVAALTIQELAMNIEKERYRESFQRLPRVREVLDRYARLSGEVGKRARHDLALVSRSEKISRKMIGALSEIGQKLTSILDLDELLKSLLDLAIENVRAERGIVFLRDEATDEMRQACARGIDKDDLEEVSTFSRNVIRRVAQGQTILTVDVGKDQGLSVYKSLVLHEIKSILCVPMRARGSVVGIIYLDTRRASQLFTEKERAFVESFAGQAAIAVENARLFGTMNAENERLRREVEGRTRFEELVGISPAMQRLREAIASVLESESNVLILGESGTGKELVARAIHYNGPRQKKKFVAIDCGALPENLLEAELFGYARGAFTGAERARIGLIEGAQGGTIFLDEITNTSMALQSRLLRVLQEHEVRRIGENEPRQVDVRVVAATNADIKSLMAGGRFRQDLYYRLNVVTIEIPPLRQRREDIPLLIDRFMKSHAREARPSKRLAADVIEILSRHDWPGNVRELENAVERLVVLSPGGLISVDDLPEGLRPAVARIKGDGSNGNGHKNGERLMIEDALRRHDGDKAKAARFIGWNRQKLYRRMRVLGIPSDYGQAA